jgi:hypothetical protein
MNRNKICPHCETEYLPHIEKCVDCGAVLLLPEEYRRAEEEKKRLGEKTVENTVAVREGDLDWLSELRAVLIDAGIPCTIHSDAGCKKACCGDKCRLVVSSADLERAQERIEEYFMEVNPELRASNELLREGKCPACGSPVGAGDRECPDCGLPLLIVEEED